MQWFFSLAPFVQALFASLFMYTMTALGAACVFFSKKPNAHLLTAFNGAAAGIMVAASFFSLLNPALEYEGALPSYLTVTLGFLLGGLFIVLSDKFLSHSRKRAERGVRGNLLYLAVTLHNVPEGLAVGVAFALSLGGADAGAAALLLAFGIAIQNFPEGLCVAFPLRNRDIPPAKCFFLAQASGLVEIPACVLGALAASVIKGLLPWALSFSAGAMIAVVCAELIPECFSGNKTVASVGVVVGFCLMMILDVALG